MSGFYECDAEETQSLLFRMKIVYILIPSILWHIAFFVSLFGRIDFTFFLILGGFLLMLLLIGADYVAVMEQMILQNDADVVKYDQMIELSEPENIAGKPRIYVSYCLEKGTCTAFRAPDLYSDSEDYLDSTLFYLSEAAKTMDIRIYAAEYSEVILNLYARAGNINELMRCDAFLSTLRGQRIDRLRQMALIHIYMLQGYYDDVRRLMEEQQRKGVTVLTNLGFRYYLAIICANEGNAREALEHSRYVFRFGGSTYYAAYLKDFLVSKNIDADLS